MLVTEYDLKAHKSTKSVTATPCRTQGAPNRPIMVFSSTVLSVERRCLLILDDVDGEAEQVWFVCSRAPPLRAQVRAEPWVEPL